MRQLGLSLFNLLWPVQRCVLMLAVVACGFGLASLVMRGDEPAVVACEVEAAKEIAEPAVGFQEEPPVEPEVTEGRGTVLGDVVSILGQGSDSRRNRLRFREEWEILDGWKSALESDGGHKARITLFAREMRPDGSRSYELSLGEGDQRQQARIVIDRYDDRWNLIQIVSLPE